MIDEPPSEDGALQASETLPLPAVVEVSDGAPGALAVAVPIVRLSAVELAETLSAASPAWIWIECAPDESDGSVKRQTWEPSGVAVPTCVPSLKTLT